MDAPKPMRKRKTKAEAAAARRFCITCGKTLARFGSTKGGEGRRVCSDCYKRNLFQSRYNFMTGMPMTEAPMAAPKPTAAMRTARVKAFSRPDFVPFSGTGNLLG